VLEFLQDGGCQIVLDMIALDATPEIDKQTAMQLLMPVASLGRRYKELLCKNSGAFHELEPNY